MAGVEGHGSCVCVFSCCLCLLAMLTNIFVRFYIAAVCSSICLFFAAAKEATAKTYVQIVIGVNILHEVLLVLGFLSSAASSYYDRLWPIMARNWVYSGCCSLGFNKAMPIWVLWIMLYGQ